MGVRVFSGASASGAADGIIGIAFGYLKLLIGYGVDVVLFAFDAVECFIFEAHKITSAAFFVGSIWGHPGLLRQN